MGHLQALTIQKKNLKIFLITIKQIKNKWKTLRKLIILRNRPVLQAALLETNCSVKKVKSKKGESLTSKSILDLTKCRKSSKNAFRITWTWYLFSMHFPQKICMLCSKVSTACSMSPLKYRKVSWLHCLSIWARIKNLEKRSWNSMSSLW